MDSYVDLLQSHGASKIMLAKGNRSQQASIPSSGYATHSRLRMLC
jgi:tartrate dehydratase beta subunit/fumarate hydratase class I family protein